MQASPPATAERISAPRLLRLVGVFVGVAIFLGLLLFHLALLVPRPASGYTTPPPESYRVLVTALGFAGLLFVDLACGVSVSVAWIMDLTRSRAPDAWRRGLFVFATAFLVSWIVMSTFFVNMLSSAIRYGY